jgi:alpha-amylase/alpha-mannosidase (GH57 family)
MPLDRFICIHGHFYQPPRENPWLEAVETQDSAHPYHDWNERITVECYEPNATSRILDSKDKIRRIVNNYASISFNFGPTLLSWLQQRAPNVYQRVLDADRDSRERFEGHGNALAQVYNHMILPLASDRDRATQVRWGLCDFEARFGRRPEGMWLPETAVDLASLEALAAEGILFTILEPHQALRVRELGSAEWTPVNGGLDPKRAFRCTLPSGRTISIFFYDGPISRAVAFEQLLARGEVFAHRLVSAFYDSAQTQLVNIATDGETYGHHHRFGDMALAYAIQYIETHKLAEITNYGLFLARHPPTAEVEIAEDTSWSCSHGVERWRSDCGCSTGAPAGWHQRWRGPLRAALNWLRDETARIFEREGSRILRDPWPSRDAYIDVILDRSEDSVKRFLSAHAAPHASPQAVLELQEMQRNAMLMFTSCGWFFNEVSGIETVQVLNYAARVLQLAERHGGAGLEEEFLRRLDQAESNLPEHGTARRLYEREIMPARLDLRRVAAHYAAASLFDSFDDQARIYCYDVTRHDIDFARGGRGRLAVGTITVRSTITWEEDRFHFAVLHLGETELTGGIRSAMPEGDYQPLKEELVAAMQPGGIPGVIRLLDAFFAETSVSIRSLFRDEQRRIFHMLCNATLEEAESAFRQLHERYDPLMRFHTRLGIPIPKVLQMAAEFDLNVQLRKLLSQEVPPLQDVEAHLREGRDERVTLDETTIMTIEQAIGRAAARFREHPENLDTLESYAALVRTVREAHVRVNLRHPQNVYYEMKEAVRPVFANNGSPDARRWLDLFDSLGETLSISAEATAG